MWMSSSPGSEEMGHGDGGVPSISGGAASIWRPAKVAMRSLMGRRMGVSSLAVEAASAGAVIAFDDGAVDGAC